MHCGIGVGVFHALVFNLIQIECNWLLQTGRGLYAGVYE